MNKGPLGKQSQYQNDYSPDLLFAISRSENRNTLKYSDSFHGYDLWRAYEFSWLDNKGVPRVAILEIKVDSSSKNIVESKSLKLYLNGFNFKTFADEKQVINLLESDLSACVEGAIEVKLSSLDDAVGQAGIVPESAKCIDDLRVEPMPEFENVKIDSLKSDQNDKLESPILLYTNLFRSVCPVTGQPDWATVFIKYQGNRIDESTLLAYLVSYRKHQGFHEDCVELIFDDLVSTCRPEKLSVYAAFTRRGGIDINPFRSNFEKKSEVGRLIRQ